MALCANTQKFNAFHTSPLVPCLRWRGRRQRSKEREETLWFEAAPIGEQFFKGTRWNLSFWVTDLLMTRARKENWLKTKLTSTNKLVGTNNPALARARPSIAYAMILLLSVRLRYSPDRCKLRSCSRIEKREGKNSLAYLCISSCDSLTRIFFYIVFFPLRYLLGIFKRVQRACKKKISRIYISHLDTASARNTNNALRESIKTRYRHNSTVYFHRISELFHVSCGP